MVKLKQILCFNFFVFGVNYIDFMGENSSTENIEAQFLNEQLDAQAEDIEIRGVGLEPAVLVEALGKKGNADYEAAGAQLYSAIRLMVLKHGNLSEEDVNEMVHKVFLSALKVIQSRALREPDRLFGYIKEIVKNEITLFYNSRKSIEERDKRYREHLIKRGQKHELTINGISIESVRRILPTLKPEYAEILTRFYFQEQTKDEIMKAMGLNEDGYRNCKHRAIMALRKEITNPQKRKKSNK